MVYDLQTAYLFLVDREPISGEPEPVQARRDRPWGEGGPTWPAAWANYPRRGCLENEGPHHATLARAGC